MSLAEVIALNNHAAVHVESSRTREAVELFRSALASLRVQCYQQLNQAHPDVLTGVDGMLTTGPSVPVVPTPSYQNEAIQCFKEDTTDMMEEDVTTARDLRFLKVSAVARFRSDILSFLNHGSDSYLAVFDRVFFMSQEPVPQDIVAAVVLFNIAVLRHMTGIQLGRAHLLVKAKNVYHMALSVLQEQAEKGLVPTMLLLAIVNNLAELASHFHESDAMRAYLDCLRALLAEVGDLDDPDYAWFCRNAMLQEPTAAAAA